MMKPWFITKKHPDGRWDFHTIDPRMARRALRERRCWITGQRIGSRPTTFYVDALPVYTAQIVANGLPEPGGLQEPMQEAMRVCPFIVGRTKANSGKKAADTAFLYTTLTWKWAVPDVIELGPPVAVEAWTKGKPDPDGGRAVLDRLHEMMRFGNPEQYEAATAFLEPA